MESPEQRGSFTVWIVVVVVFLIVSFAAYTIGRNRGEEKYHHISAFAWDQEQWAERTKGIRTSYNPDHDLNTETLTLSPGDERWLDFVFWCVNNKVAEHQVEAYGGTEWEGPQGGIIFHWAPGSRWETHTLASFGFTIGHVIGEHKWKDTQFPEFFEAHGGVYGISVKDRLTEIDRTSAVPWVQFLEYIGGADSPYYRYLFHQEVVVDPVNEKIYLIGGQGVGFEYSFERYYHEAREVLTDAKAFQFFQLYDLYGPGFASIGGWAKNKLAASLHGIYFTDNMSKWSTKPGVAKAAKYDPDPPSPEIPETIPERESIVRGEMIYRQQCLPCHGAAGDGNGFLGNGFDIKPRDFRQGIYKFRTTKTGELPMITDVEKSIRDGVSNGTMPAWGQFLTGEQISDVARYLIIFSERFTEAWKRGEKPELLSVPPPPEDLTSMVAKGRRLYKLGQCDKCHGENGKGDGPSASTLVDEWSIPILPTNLTYKWLFANGYSPTEIYRTFNGGLNGTPMPSYLNAFPDETEEDRWALVAYVLSLSPQERPAIRLSEYKENLRSSIDGQGVVRR